MIPMSNKAKLEADKHEHKKALDYLRAGAEEKRKDEAHQVKMRGFSHGANNVQVMNQQKMNHQDAMHQLKLKQSDAEHKQKMKHKDHSQDTKTTMQVGKHNNAMGFESGTLSIPPLPSSVYNPGNSGYASGIESLPGPDMPDHVPMPNGSFNYGGTDTALDDVHHYARGARMVPRPTNPEAGPSDTVPAMLTPGEAVIPREAAQDPRLKPVVKQLINHGRQVQQMNRGGSVPPMHQMPDGTMMPGARHQYNNGTEEVDERQPSPPPPPPPPQLPEGLGLTKRGVKYDVPMSRDEQLRFTAQHVNGKPRVGVNYTYKFGNGTMSVPGYFEGTDEIGAAIMSAAAQPTAADIALEEENKKKLAAQTAPVIVEPQPVASKIPPPLPPSAVRVLPPSRYTAGVNDIVLPAPTMRELRTGERRAQVTPAENAREMARLQTQTKLPEDYSTVPAIPTETQVAAVPATSKAEVPQIEPTESFINRVTQKNGPEGTGKSPYSSAQGLGQFIDSTAQTWIDRAQADKNNPLYGKTLADVRANPDLQMLILKQQTAENTGILKSKGLPVTQENLYIIHALGAGRGSELLSADPNTPLTDLKLPADVIKQNAPWFTGAQTVGDIQRNMTNWYNRKTLTNEGVIKEGVAPVNLPTVQGSSGRIEPQPGDINYGPGAYPIDNAPPKVDDSTAAISKRFDERTAEEEKAVATATAIINPPKEDTEFGWAGSFRNVFKELAGVFGFKEKEVRQLAAIAAASKMLGYSTRGSINAAFKYASQSAQSRETKEAAVQAKADKRTWELTKLAIQNKNAIDLKRIEKAPTAADAKKAAEDHINNLVTANVITPEAGALAKNAFAKGGSEAADAILKSPTSQPPEVQLQAKQLGITKDKPEQYVRPGFKNPVDVYRSTNGKSYTLTNGKYTEVNEELRPYSHSADSDKTIFEELKARIPTSYFKSKDNKNGFDTDQRVVIDGIEQFARQQARFNIEKEKINATITDPKLKLPLYPEDPRYYTDAAVMLLQADHANGVKQVNMEKALEMFMLGGQRMIDPSRNTNDKTEKPVTSKEYGVMLDNIKSINPKDPSKVMGQLDEIYSANKVAQWTPDQFKAKLKQAYPTGGTAYEVEVALQQLEDAPNNWARLILVTKANSK